MGTRGIPRFLNVLFVDEAGQMSLANVLACAPAGNNLVLLGDPQQLEQPQKGSHPEGSDVSALAHLLDGRKIIEPDRGLFLGTTWRLHPTICEFTSELFYEGVWLRARGSRSSAFVHPMLFRARDFGCWLVGRLNGERKMEPLVSNHIRFGPIQRSRSAANSCCPLLSSRQSVWQFDPVQADRFAVRLGPK